MAMILLLDCNYLCFRAYWTTGRQLENGTVYGFLSTLQSLRAKFAPDRIAFCFDGEGKNLRRIEYPDYKKRTNVIRSQKDVDSVLDRREVQHQIKLLRDKHLSNLGFNNIFHRPGFEADDVIASICQAPCKGCEGRGKREQKYLSDQADWTCDDCRGTGRDGEPKLVVSADHDLYQLLEDDRIRMYEPSKGLLLDAAGFREQWGIDPKLWPNVKAIAGCHSDNIPGVGGVGEKTAAKYLAHGTQTENTPKKLEKVWSKVQEKIDLVKFNLRLVRLPWEGVGTFEIREDEATGGRWREWCEKNKMLSLIRERKSQWTPSRQSVTSSVRKRKGGTPSTLPSSQ